MPKDLYAVLGINRDASAEDVKKAYRTKSKEWHPDKHKGDKSAETKFKEINEAYEVLGNAEKRKSYDQFGTTGGPGGGGGQGFGGFDFSGFQNGNFGDFADMFEGFFGGQGGGRRSRPADQTGGNLEVEVTIELKDVLEGIQVPLSLKRQVKCDTCEGSGAEKGASVITCTECGGTGQVTRTAQSFFGQIQQRSVCPTCRGSGKIPEKPCRTCSGEGRVSEKSQLTIDIPPGIEDGQALRIRGQGDAGRRGAGSGDLFVHVRVRPDNRFERQGADIRSVVDVPVLTAILGGEVEVATVQGEVTMKIDEGTQPNAELRLKGKGLPVLGSSRQGDHYVTVRVEIPQKLSRAERKILEEWKEAQG